MARPDLDLSVAGVTLAFRAAPGLSIEAPGFEYPPFLGRRPAARVVPIEVDVCSEPPAPLPVEFDTRDGWRLVGDGTHCRAEMPCRDGGTVPSWTATWTRPIDKVRVEVAPALLRARAVRHLVQYPLDQILLCESQLEQGGLLLHAAGGLTPYGGIAFAGVSGAGKSTICKLLGGVNGFRFASDDRVFLRLAGHGVTLHGTPWAGDERIAADMSAPLAALCFLRHDRITQLCALSAADALERLLPVVTVPWFDRERMDVALALCAHVIESTRCVELRFQPDAKALARALGVLTDAA